MPVLFGIGNALIPTLVALFTQRINASYQSSRECVTPRSLERNLKDSDELRIDFLILRVVRAHGSDFAWLKSRV
jgi:hypothetical protein